MRKLLLSLGALAVVGMAYPVIQPAAAEEKVIIKEHRDRDRPWFHRHHDYEWFHRHHDHDHRVIIRKHDRD